MRGSGKSRSHAIEVISLDMGPGYAPSARTHAPQATIAIDPFLPVVALGDRALDDVRRAYCNKLRELDDPDAARRFKDARWSLLKAPDSRTSRVRTQIGCRRRARWRGTSARQNQRSARTTGDQARQQPRGASLQVQPLHISALGPPGAGARSALLWEKISAPVAVGRNPARASAECWLG